MKILVTGGLGFIGSHTVVELLNEGYEVIIVDNLSNSNVSVLNGIEKITKIKPLFINLDLSDSSKVDELFRLHPEIEGVIHFAAFKAVGESVSNPLKYYHNNLYSLINLLNVIDRLQLKVSFIFSSSCTVYGQPDVLPIDEATEKGKTESPYGYTKQICEQILSDFSSTNNLIKFVSLRYFNPIGAHPSGEIGELPLGKPENLVPYITQSARGARGPLVVFGNDYDTVDGTCVRDYIDVVDLSQAHIAALKRLISKKELSSHYEVFNLGTGEGKSVMEVIRSFEKANGLKVNYSIGPRREGDVQSIYADVKKAKNELGWETKIDLEESLKNAWNWELKYSSK